MCAAGTSTLAVSGQVSVLVLTGALFLGAVSLCTRNKPLPLQRSAWFLNGGLAAVLVLSVWPWWEGSPAIVALAHLATGTLGLKLFDARPRKSEFLLVSLSLLQVVAAANLTDSVFYPILVGAFSAFAVWTLLVHTLACEALEAGMPGAEKSVLSPGLFKITLLASLLTFMLALAIFPLLPRMRTGAFMAAGPGTTARSGFSDRVALGDIGRIRKDARLALRVEIVRGAWPSPSEAYWRGLAFDHFDGTTWTVASARRKRLSGNAAIGMVFARGRSDASVHRIFRESIDSGVLFSAGPAAGLRGPVGHVEQDANGSLYAEKTASRRIEYMVRSESRRPDGVTLRGDLARPPADGERYVAKISASPEVVELARSFLAEGANDYERIAAVERHLIEEGRYTDTPPAYGDSEGSPIDAFLLGETAGHCEYFASAMVLLLRELGYPARLVTGFAGGERNKLGDFIALSRADAHSWVEVHFERAGWVRFDPTPPDLRLAGSARLSARDQLGELASAIELWWFRNFVDYDRERQLKAFTWVAARMASAAPATPAKRGTGEATGTPSLRALWLGLVALAGISLWLWLRGRGRASSAPGPTREYRRALRLLARHGLRREASTPARDFARQVAAATRSEAGESFEKITERYLAERFGGIETSSGGADLARLDEGLRKVAA